MGIPSRFAVVLSVLATAGCVQPQWTQPPISGLGPPVPLNALPPQPPVVFARPVPERLAPPPAAFPPEEPAVAEPDIAAPAQPPFSDGTPFSEDRPAYAEPAAPPPEVAPPRPAVRATERGPAVPMVGFRPMRPPGSRSY